jgi:alkylation response protein AidB-like acyl-CoA dehydrogenase
MELRFESLTKIVPGIRARATGLDRSGQWPEEDLRELGAIGVWRWFVPVRFGGEGIDPLELHLRYEAIASASLATALVVSQRDSAVGLIEGGESAEMREEILPGLARGDFFSTIGIAQLTTSKQAGLRAFVDGDGFRLDGLIPWSTGAGKAKVIVAGAAIENVGSDGQQILFVLPMDLAGVRVAEPMELVALRSSWTAQVRLENVRLDRRWVLRGPVEKALSGRSKGIVLPQAFLAFGLCRAALLLMEEEGSERAKMLTARFGEQLAGVRSEVLDVCRGGKETERVPQLRAACNDLAVRMTQAAVALFKGSALRMDHPAQRMAREAMFFLVWSCPDAVIDCTVNLLVQ